MNLTIKHYHDLTPDELYRILQIRAEVFVVEQHCFYNDLDNKDKQAYHLWLSDDHTLLAYLRVLDQGVSFADAGSIGRVLTAQQVRGQGHGKVLMQHGIDVAQDKFGLSKIRIHAQAYASAFYEQLGFVICSEPFLEDGIPHVEMILQR